MCNSPSYVPIRGLSPRIQFAGAYPYISRGRYHGHVWITDVGVGNQYIITIPTIGYILDEGYATIVPVEKIQLSNNLSVVAEYMYNVALLAPIRATFESECITVNTCEVDAPGSRCGDVEYVGVGVSNLYNSFEAALMGIDVPVLENYGLFYNYYPVNADMKVSMYGVEGVNTKITIVGKPFDYVVKVFVAPFDAI